MKNPISRKLNRENLIHTSVILNHISPIPFFGTLLGLVREGDVIKSDDDVDLYIDIRDRQRAISAMNLHGYTQTINEINFLQFSRVLSSVETFVDIYLYENDPDKNYIIDRWNFHGRPDDQDFHIYIDKSLIFPLKKRNIFGKSFFFPRKSKKVCRYLYGDMWEDPCSKFNRKYKVYIYNNSPINLREGELGFHILNRIKCIEHSSSKLIKDGAEQFQREKEELLAQISSGRHEIEMLNADRDGLKAGHDAEKGDLPSK